MPSSRMVTTTPWPVYLIYYKKKQNCLNFPHLSITFLSIVLYPLFQAGCTFMSNPPLAPLLRCHCILKSGSEVTEAEFELEEEEEEEVKGGEKLLWRWRFTWRLGS